MSNHQSPQEVSMIPEPLKQGTFEDLESKLCRFQIKQIAEYGKKILRRNADLYQRLLIKYAVLYRREFAPQVSESDVAVLVAMLLTKLEE